MRKLSSVNKVTITAVCLALCCVLPMAFHAFGLGYAFSPMHIPVLLCGLVCGCWHGILCGIAGPILSSIITGMPQVTGLIGMVPELAVYGFVAGLMMRLVRTKKLFADLYIALGTAMIAGRIVGGIANALFYLGNGNPYSLSIWVASYFVNAAPGIVCHLVIIPLLVFTLAKARLIPTRYSQKV